MSGHITRMSRGSRVGSSSSSPTSTSRSTSTCRAGPWQACTCTEPVARAGRRAARSSGVGRAVGAQVVLEPAEQRVGLAPGPRRPRGCGRQRRRGCGAARGRRGRARRAAGGRPRSAEVVVGAGHRPAEAGASASHSAGEGCGSHRCTSRCSPSARQQLDLGDRQPGVPEERQPRRQVEAAAAGAQPGHGVARGARSGGGASTRASSRRHSSACQRRSSSSAPPAPSVSRPSRQSVTSARPLHGVRREQAGQPARHD